MGSSGPIDREDLDKHISWPMGVIIDVRELSDKIVCSATVKIGNKMYDRPLQRLYELEGLDQGQSTNELLQLIDSDDESSQVGDDTPSQVKDLPAGAVRNEQAKSFIDPNPPGGEELTGEMGEEAWETEVLAVSSPIVPEAVERWSKFSG